MTDTCCMSLVVLILKETKIPGIIINVDGSFEAAMKAKVSI